MDKINIKSYLSMHLEQLKGFCASMIALTLILASTATSFDTTEVMVLIGYAVFRLGWFLWRNPIEYHECMNRRHEDRHV